MYVFNAIVSRGGSKLLSSSKYSAKQRQATQIMSFDTTWIPTAFHAMKNAISSYHREETPGNEIVERTGFVEQVLECCSAYLRDWKVASATLPFEQAKLAGMVGEHDPFCSPNGTRSLVGQKLFRVFVVGLLRMRIGLMSTRPLLSDHLPDRIDCNPLELKKGNLAYWISSARSRFLDLFASRDTLPSMLGEMSPLEFPQDTRPQSCATLLHQAQSFAECSDQMRFLSNLVYTAWALRSFMETGDAFLVSMKF